jgi:hypothetical protein
MGLQAGPTFDERWPAVEAQLLEAEAAFKRLGPWLGFVPSLPEHVYERHQVAIGAAVVANKKALIDAERQRIKAQTEGGISATDKQRRLDELRVAVLRLSAQRELLVREVEGREFHARPVHAELVVYRQYDVERLATGGRHAAR